MKWTCPTCNQTAEIQPAEIRSSEWPIDHPKLQSHETRFLSYRAIVCPNPDCGKLQLVLDVLGGWRNGMVLQKGIVIKTLTLEPPSKPLPDYVPKAIRDDYAEAWSIKELSPKAAATLARRALQGMIRDYWQIKSEARLKDEIDTIRPKVDALTWKAIDAVRTVGNIGAHMERDVNLIVDVEPAEADQLLWLVETLVRDWYTRRDSENKRLEELARIAASKKVASRP